MEWTPRPLVEHLREQERHNVTVITVGSKYEVYVRSPASSHMQTLKQPFQTLAIKWVVNIFLKKSFLRLYHAFSFLRLYRCVAVDDNITLQYTGIYGSFDNIVFLVLGKIMRRIPTFQVLYQAYGCKERTKHRVSNQTTRRQVKS